MNMAFSRDKISQFHAWQTQTCVAVTTPSTEEMLRQHRQWLQNYQHDISLIRTSADKTDHRYAPTNLETTEPSPPKLYPFTKQYVIMIKRCNNSLAHFHCRKQIISTPSGSLKLVICTYWGVSLFKPRPGQKFENENFCFRHTPAVVKACHPFRVRLIKTLLYKT